MKHVQVRRLLLLASLVATPTVLLLAVSPATAQAPAAAANAVLRVDRMHCATCSLTVRTVLRRLEGVSAVTVSAAEKTARVTYDPARVTPDRMAQAVTDAGYPARVLP